MLKTILNPDLYHGKNKKNNFFEGWYFKLVHPNKNYVLCFIPGITLSTESHSFIQVLESNPSAFSYARYKVNDFRYYPSRFYISIAANSFSLEELQVNLKIGNKHIKGHLKFRNTVKWPDNIMNPGSMGFYNYLTFMQCYSQVCSMDSEIVGELTINDTVIDFSGGKAYIEKNWGRDFPYSYIWAQCNNFNSSDVSLTCSIAHIPFPIASFTGFLIGLHIKDKFYKFTTVNGSKININSSDNNVTVDAHTRSHLLRFTANAPSNSFMNLFAPRKDKMIPIAKESLQADIAFQLFDNSTKSCILNTQGCCGGLEFSGNYQSLNSNKTYQ
jgi:hypothetical protein